MGGRSLLLGRGGRERQGVEVSVFALLVTDLYQSCTLYVYM